MDSDAEQTKSGAILGTPSYMAPEQASGRATLIGPATDVYALGAILYEMLTGRPPFRAPTVIETLDQVRSLEPLSVRRIQPRVPRDLETICLKCLNKEPARRYATAAALADDLDRFLRGEPVLARPVSTSERTWKWCRRHPLVTALLAMLLLVTTGGFGGIFAQWQTAESLRELADDNARAARVQRDVARQERADAEANRKLADNNRIAADSARESAVKNQQQAELNLASAEARFQKARSAVNELLQVGQDLLRQPKMFEQGRDIVERAVELQQSLLDEKSTDPTTRHETARAFKSLGWTLHEIRHDEDALATTLKAVDLLHSLRSSHPDHRGMLRDLRATHFQAAHLQRSLRKFSDADGSFAESLRIAESLAESETDGARDHVALANVLLNWSVLLRATGDARKAESAVRRSVDILRPLTEAHPEVSQYRAELSMSAGQLSAMIWIKDLKAGEALARESLALLLQLQETKNGLRAYAEYTARSHQLVGDICLATGRESEAASHFQAGHDLLARALAEFPQNVAMRSRMLEIRERLIEVAQRRGDHDQAAQALPLLIHDLRGLVADAPDNAEYGRRLARLYTRQARHSAERDSTTDAAQPFYDAVIKYRDELGTARDREKHAELVKSMAIEFTRLGRTVAGEARLIEVAGEFLKLAPDDPTAMNSLAWWLVIARDPKLIDAERAIKLANQAVALKPEVASYHNTLGTALYRADQLPAARAAFEKSLVLKSTIPAADWYFLAAIAHRDGRPDEARKLFDQAQADHQQNHAKDADLGFVAEEVGKLLK